MCGIVGCAGNLLQKDVKAFRDMLLMDVVRGQDSTGIVRVEGNKDKKLNFVEYHKELGGPDNLWNEYSPCKWLDLRGVVTDPSCCLIGHNRAATMGKITVENAHPFQFDHITGVHNGTLYNTDKLEGNHDVDSKQIFYTISKKGIEETWKGVGGAAALVWWDEDKHTLNVIRNDQRTLYFLESASGSLYWASEAWMIEVAMMRNKVNPKKKGGRPELFEKNHHYEFDVSWISCKLKSKTELEAYKYEHTGSWGYSYPGFSHAQGSGMAKVEKRKEDDPVNLDWAVGIKKADKKFRGLEGKLDYVSRCWDNDSDEFKYYAMAGVKGDKPSRMQIFFQTIKEYREWSNMLKDINFEYELKLRARPRYKKFNGDATMFMISTKYVDVIKKERVKSKTNLKVYENGKLQSVHPMPDEDDEIVPTFSGYGNNLYTEAELSEHIKNAGGCCASCQTSLNVEDHDKISWPTKDCMLCEVCKEDPYISQYLSHM